MIIKVKWPFLQRALRMKGFNESWRSQVDAFIQKGGVGIKVNDDMGHYFQTHKGLRQEDSMSPVMFDIVADMLAVVIGWAKENGQVGALVPHLVEGGYPYYNTLMTPLFSWSTTTRRPGI